MNYNHLYESFLSQYEEIYKERWPSLLKALQQPTKHACLINPFSNPIHVSKTLQKSTSSSSFEQIPFLNIPCLKISNNKENESGREMGNLFEKPEMDDDNVMGYYLLDAASVMPPMLLNIKPGDMVLDVCAAPGGKSLCLAYKLFSKSTTTTNDSSNTNTTTGTTGTLVCNEIQKDRRQRLQKVLMQYLPNSLHQYIKTPSFDATQPFPNLDSLPNQYDKILVDAPCSSERHLLHHIQTQHHNIQSLFGWTPQTSKSNHLRQLQILLNSIQKLKPNGLIMYSTCSLNPLENDQTIKRVLEKCQKMDVRMKCLSRKWRDGMFMVGEKTEFGWIVLPDTSDGWGPLYFSLLKRVD